MATVFIYVNTCKQVGDVDEATAETWLAGNDPEGVAFEYEVME
jgi:hypothetical protein